MTDVSLGIITPTTIRQCKIRHPTEIMSLTFVRHMASVKIAIRSLVMMEFYEALKKTQGNTDGEGWPPP